MLQNSFFIEEEIHKKVIIHKIKLKLIKMLIITNN